MPQVSLIPSTMGEPHSHCTLVRLPLINLEIMPEVRRRHEILTNFKRCFGSSQALLVGGLSVEERRIHEDDESGTGKHQCKQLTMANSWQFCHTNCTAQEYMGEHEELLS